MKYHRKLSTPVFLTKFNHLISKADGSEATYGFTAAQITAAKAIRDDLEANEAARAANKAEGKALTTQGKARRKEADELVSLLKISSASKQIPISTQQVIGFGDDDLIKSKIAVFDPTDLVTTGSSNGINTSKWNKNGNKEGTIFSVEALIGAATDFVIVGTTTGVKFEHKNQKPGVKTIYRVRAQRGDDFSDYSNEATVYDTK